MPDSRRDERQRADQFVHDLGTETCETGGLRLVGEVRSGGGLVATGSAVISLR